MPLALPPDVVTITDEELKELFGDSVPCDDQPCDKPAGWTLIASCGHTCNVCSYHKAMNLHHFKMHTPNTWCHLDKTVRVTDLKAEPL